MTRGSSSNASRYPCDKVVAGEKGGGEEEGGAEHHDSADKYYRLVVCGIVIFAECRVQVYLIVRRHGLPRLAC